MPTYTAPGVYYEVIDRPAAGISPIRTDLAAFLGIAEKGPADTPIVVQTWEQFQSIFGDFLPNGFLAYSAKAFFENGGRKLYGIRVVAPLQTTETSAAPQPADGSSSLVSSISGFVAGAVVTATQIAVAHSAGVQPADRASSLADTIEGFPLSSIARISQAVPTPLQTWRRVSRTDPATKRLVWDSPLDATSSLANPLLFESSHSQDLLLRNVDAVTRSLVWSAPLSDRFNLQQTITFATGGCPASGVFYDKAGFPTLSIEAVSPGTWGNDVVVGVSESSLAATVSSALTQPISGNASFVLSVTGFTVHSLVRIFQFNSPTPILDYRVVKQVDATVNLLGWDAPLAPQFDVTRPISFETVEFGLAVFYKGEVEELFSGLSIIAGHPRYATSAVISQYISVNDLHSPAPVSDTMPNPEAPQLDNRRLLLQCGRDGIAALTATSFIGDPASEIKWGLRTLEDVDEVCIIAAADILIPPSPATTTLPPPATPPACCPVDSALAPAISSAPVLVEAAPVFSLDDIYRVQQAMVQHCEAMQFRFAVLDPPSTDTPLLHTDLREVQSWRQRFDTSYAALYFPWVLVRDPLQGNNRIVRRIPPSGHVVGVYANTDLTVGVHKAPANTALLWAQDLTFDVTTEVQEGLNPIGIDCLRSFAGRGLRVYGARTMSSDPSWRYVNVRRLVSMIEHVLVISLQWSVFEPNNVHLWNKIRVAATGFLQMLWSKGALAGNTAEEAFFVRCDANTNPSYLTEVGQLIVEIGVAPVIPAEFVVFRIGRTEDVLEVTEA